MSVLLCPQLLGQGLGMAREGEMCAVGMDGQMGGWADGRRPSVGPGSSQEHAGWAPVTCDSFLLSHSAAGHRAKGVEACAQEWSAGFRLVEVLEA